MMYIRTAKKVEAIQWLGNNAKEIFEKCVSDKTIMIGDTEFQISIQGVFVKSESMFCIETEFGTTESKIGSWIIFDDNSIYFVSNEYFQENFLNLSNK